MIASGFATLSAFLCVAALPAEIPDEFENTIRPFFAAHCLKCHDQQTQHGDLRIDKLSLNFGEEQVFGNWTDILDRINSGEMPPAREPSPDPQVAARIVEWIATQLAQAESQRHAQMERVSFYKLTRDEYANTLRDLLGVTYDARDTTGLSEDPDWLGFERIGSVLSLAPSHVEKYLSAADAVLNEALALGGPGPRREVIHWGPAELRPKWGTNLLKVYDRIGTRDRVRVSVVPNNSADGTPGSSVGLRLETTGDYLIRVKLSGLRPPGGRAPRISIQETTLDRTLLARDVDAPEDQPVVFETRVHLPAGQRQIRIMNDVPGPEPTPRKSRDHHTAAFTGLNTRFPWQLKLTDDDYRPIWPFLLVDYVEWEGPIVESWPTPAHRRIFGNGEGDIAHARDIVARFAERAFRRPVSAAEVDRYSQLVDAERVRGKAFESAVKTALLAILCSKDFLYLVEGSPKEAATQLTDYEVASRLSYFLWSTLPDERLFELARDGKLHDPITLRSEVHRMLADPRALQFAEAFPSQWLQLRQVGMFPPDKSLYPDYDDYLEQSMKSETTGFFREVLSRNLSLREFLDSDWTMLNERLALHYGIAGVHGEAIQRVTLPPGDQRGGLLTHAAPLSMTSDGTRHRPIHRGKWLAECILGRPVPPPPASVPAIASAATGEPKSSLREKLVAHLEDATCAACHVKIDPLGFAFENYDAIGRWRTEEEVRDGSGANPLVDASGTLPDGRHFDDARAFKRLLLDETDTFAAAFTEKLATYALRRVMTFADRESLKEIASQARPQDYRLRDLIEALVASELFLKR